MSNNSPGTTAEVFEDTYEDEDAETKQDFDDFKAWLEKRGAPPKSQSPRVDKRPQPEPLKVIWRCNLCKEITDTCNWNKISSSFFYIFCRYYKFELCDV